MKKAEYRKLLRWAIVLLSLWLLIFSILIITRLMSDRENYITSEVTRLEAYNKLASSSMEEYFGKIEISLKTADFWLTNHPEADPRFDETFLKLIELLESDMASDVDFRLISKEGGLFYMPSDSHEPLADISDRNYYQVQLSPDTKGLYFGSPVKSRVTAIWGIPVSYPLTHDKHGISVIFAAIEVPKLERLLSSYKIDDSSKIFIVRSDGKVLASSPIDETLLGNSISELASWKTLEEGSQVGSLLIKSTDINGDNQYVTRERIGNTSLYVLSTIQCDLLDLPVDQIITPGIFLIILLAIVFSLMGLAIYNLLKKLDQALQEVTELSNTDSLSSLQNRRSFVQDLQQEIQRHRRYEQPFSLALMDIDHFKKVNDTFGHDIGDQVIVQVSKILKTIMRETDVVGRWGGEEFIILLVNTDLEQAIPKIETIRATIEHTDYSPVKSITVSFGVTEYVADESYHSLVGRADNLMYQSKQNGRNRITY